MINQFLFVGFPYLALALLVIGTFVRFYLHRFSISSLSSQFLEDRLLGLGSVPWHFGIFLVFIGHLFAFAFPQTLTRILASPLALATFEILGIGAALACAFGLATLLVRRMLRGRLNYVTNLADYVVLGLLLAEVVLGILVAISHRWGSLWATGTVMPYVWSLLRFQPNVDFVIDLPPLVKTHLFLAFIIIGAIPFTRLIHALFVPLQYLVRAPQRVIWTSKRRQEFLDKEPGGDPDLARRHLVEGVVGAGAAAALLGVGVADKLVKYFAMPSLPKDVKKELLNERHLRLVMTAEERALELERLSNDFILVGAYNELSAKSGRYFIDYDMKPALAFVGDDGLPNLISAKCTHLGCTVSKDVDAEGRILCPCHVSYFDVKTGKPNEGAPAKVPLPKLAWAIRDATGKTIASMDADGRLTGNRDRDAFLLCNVYLVKTTRAEVL